MQHGRAKEEVDDHSGEGPDGPQHQTSLPLQPYRITRPPPLQGCLPEYWKLLPFIRSVHNRAGMSSRKSRVACHCCRAVAEQMTARRACLRGILIVIARESQSGQGVHVLVLQACLRACQQDRSPSPTLAFCLALWQPFR